MSGGNGHLADLMKKPLSALSDEELAEVREAESERSAIASHSAKEEAIALLVEEHRRTRIEKLVLRCFADVAPEAIAWLWPGMVPAGRLALLVGDPGVGKSLAAVDLAAHVSTGTAWPDGTAGLEPADVVILAAEDSPGDYRTRLDAAGADVSRVHILEAIREDDGERPVTLADVQAIDDAVSKLHDAGRRVALVILDTVGALLAPGVDDSSNGDVRVMLRPLAALAASTGAAVVGIHHLRKSAGQALHRTLGSVGWTAAARAVLAVVRDREQHARRLLVVLKSNYAPEQPEGALAFTVDADQAGRPLLLWSRDRVAVDPEAALSPPEDPSDRAAGDEALEWLRAALANGPQAAADLRKEARSEGIADRTLRRASKRLDVVIERTGFPCRSTWRLPDGQLGQASPVGPSPAARPNTAQQGQVGLTAGPRPGELEIF